MPERSKKFLLTQAFEPQGHFAVIGKIKTCSQSQNPLHPELKRQDKTQPVVVPIVIGIVVVAVSHASVDVVVVPRATTHNTPRAFSVFTFFFYFNEIYLLSNFSHCFLCNFVFYKIPYQNG